MLNTKKMGENEIDRPNFSSVQITSTFQFSGNYDTDTLKHKIEIP